jgi:predicted enzyme related to lactoylglutathione lyase
MIEESKCLKPGQFTWNELVTTDEAAAGAFYTLLFDWTAELFGGGGQTYTLFKKGSAMVGGMMKCPKTGLPAHWLAYVTCEDVDAAAKQAAALGGSVLMAPFDVPTVGRIAIVLDPQGASLGLFKPVK